MLYGSRPTRWGMYPLVGKITMTGHLSVTITPTIGAYSPLAAVGKRWARPSVPQTVSHLSTIWAPAAGRPGDHLLVYAHIIRSIEPLPRTPSPRL